jgi:aminoglycoside phosphotransferase (APT) family kinase protein
VRSPLLTEARVQAFLDARGLGSGTVVATRIGAGGGSNFTFLIERGSERFVLRRPPQPPLPPSAHDMPREVRLQEAVRAGGFRRLPEIVALCEDEHVLGVPFYVMRFIDGHVITTTLPPGLEAETARFALGLELVDTLADIHRVDLTRSEFAPFTRPGSYLKRQVRRFSQLWEINKTREIQAVEEVGRLLAEHFPDPTPSTVVHGDYRLGNVIVGEDHPGRIMAVLDWELGAIGDPRADLGYLLASYSEPDGEPSTMGTSPATAEAGFPRRGQLIERYVAQSGREVERLGWFEALALWKSAVFCEAIYGRYVRGELGAEDTRAAIYRDVVPARAEAALAALLPAYLG